MCVFVEGILERGEGFENLLIVIFGGKGWRMEVILCLRGDRVGWGGWGEEDKFRDFLSLFKEKVFFFF